MKHRNMPVDKITSMIVAPPGWRAVRRCQVINNQEEFTEVFVSPVIGWASYDDAANENESSHIEAIVAANWNRCDIIEGFYIDGSDYMSIIGYLQPGETFDEKFWLLIAKEKVLEEKNLHKSTKDK